MKIFVAVFLCYMVIAVNGIANRGEIAVPDEFPFMVSIQVLGEHCAGGSLISKKHVLTAAHSIEEFVINKELHGIPIVVEVGSIYLGQGKTHSIRRISYSRGFTKEGPLFLPNDIAIIHLMREVEVNNHVQLIALPKTYSDVPDGTNVIVVGFGQAGFTGSNSPVLKKLETRTVSIQNCQTHHGGTIQTTNICASRGPEYGICPGDSGGPMVDVNKKTIIGIISGGNGQCGSGDPDVYTKVSYFKAYINEEMKINTSKPVPAGKNPAINIDVGSSSSG